MRKLLLAILAASALSIYAVVITPSNTALVASGDSQTAAGSTWFFSLTNASTCVGFGSGGWVVYTNAAHSGDGLTDIDNRYTNEVRVYTNNYPGKVIVMTLNGGANSDLYTTTNRWLTNVLAMSNMIIRAKADNFIVVHFNLLVRGGYVGGVTPIGWSNDIYKVNWTNYNAWCASSNNPADLKMDWSSLVPPSTLGNTNYWSEATPDELHLTLWANRMVSTNLALLLTTNTAASSPTNFTSISASGFRSSGGLILR